MKERKRLKKPRQRLIPKLRNRLSKARNGNYDDYCNEIVSKNISMSVPWYLMASYVYYELGQSLITDGCFDKMAKIMLVNWPVIEHMHKPLIKKSHLRAGSSDIKIPNMAKGGAESLLKDINR